MIGKTSEEIKQAKEYPMIDMLTNLGIEISKDRMICCPYHTEKTPSAKVGDKNMLNCFGCGKKGADTIDVYMQIMGVDFITAVDAINSMGEGSVKATISTAVHADSKETAGDKYRKFLRFFKPYIALNCNKRKIVDDYLNTRHLEGVLNVLHENKLDIGLDSRDNVCWALNGFGIVISTSKSNMGSPVPTLIKAHKDEEWMIAEGMTDALSAVLLGYNAISLNSVNNLDKLIDRLSSSGKSKAHTYVIATDTDRAGLDAKNKLQIFFQKNNYNFYEYTPLYLSDCKDLNEFFVLAHEK